MAKFKLTYFDFSGSRGEECRLALYAAGADFEDNRLSREAWAELKPKTPFGGLPLLEVEGRPPLAQSNAILAYIGREHGLHPSEPWAAARHEAILHAVEDLRAAMAPLSRVKDEEEKKRTRAEFVAGYLHTWASNLEQQIEGPFVAGDTLHVADIKLFVICHSLSSGIYDHIPTTVLTPYPKLSALYAAVAAHPRVAQWRARTA